MFGFLNLFKSKVNTPFGVEAKNLKYKAAEEGFISPFAIRKGDTHSMLPFAKRCGVNEIEFLLQKSVIGDLEIEILKGINKMIFATSMQITEHLSLRGFDVSQKKVQQRLKLLQEKNVIASSKFMTEDSTASFKVYSLFTNGSYILKNRDVKLHQIGFAKTATTEDIKRILATNQLLMKLSLATNIEYMTRQTLWCEHDKNLIVRPQAVFMVGDESYLVECVRGMSEVTLDIREKFQRYDSVLRRYEEVCIPFKSKPTLIVLCESEKDMLEIRDTVKNGSLKKQPVLLCYDHGVFVDVKTAFYDDITM